MDAKTFGKKAFDQYKITHVLPRLSSPNPDYLTYFDLSAAPEWQLTHLDANTGVFYRKDVNDPELRKYLASHSVNFLENAYRTEAEEMPPRPESARARTFYQEYLSLPQTKQSNSIQLAQHHQVLLQLATMGSYRVPPELAASFAILAIQHANRGLFDDPQNALGYQLLGSAYEFLGRLEPRVMGLTDRKAMSVRRFYQAVNAYRQVLLINPHSPQIHQRLLELYLDQNKIDLAIQAMDGFDKFIETETNLTDEQLRILEQHTRLREQMNKTLEQVNSRIEQAREQGANPLALAQFAFDAGCVKLALELIEEDPDLLNSSLPGQLLKIRMLLEAGRSAEANNQVQKQEAVAELYDIPGWRPMASAFQLDAGRLRLRHTSLEKRSGRAAKPTPAIDVGFDAARRDAQHVADSTNHHVPLFPATHVSSRGNANECRAQPSRSGTSAGRGRRVSRTAQIATRQRLATVGRFLF